MIGDDLTPFFVAGEFSHGGDLLGGVAVAGIFDSAYVRAGGGLGMSSIHPAYSMASAAVPAEPIGQLLTHKSINYSVVDLEPDGTGLTVLILEVS
ncbi:hypothetical protein ACEN9F_13400 [Duganella sp. CT11-25]|uniref:head-tail joining protein n=1 Tax=unclassified Duganella TaxID=2636909 RepID=UPI0039B07305